jgi:putative effector of murein hydrolase
VFGIKKRVAAGLSIGTSSTRSGPRKAIEIGEIEGAMSALSIGIAGLFTVFYSLLFMP